MFFSRCQPLALCALEKFKMFSKTGDRLPGTASELLKFFFSLFFFLAFGLNLCGADHNFQKSQTKGFAAC